MKILLVNNYGYPRGGAETIFLNTGELLKSKGHQVILFSRFVNANQNNKINFSIKDSQFFFNRFYSFAAKRKISEIIESSNPDIIHLNNIIGGITFSILPEIKKRKIPVLMTIHDFRMLCPVGIFINGNKIICEKCKVRKYYNCILNKCNPNGLLKNIMITSESYLRDLFLPHEKYIDKYIFVSNSTKKKFLEYHPNLNSKSEVLYNFTTIFNKEIIRGDYFLFVGRLDREKGLKTLISVFKELTQHKLIIIGRGELENEIKNLDSPNIKFLGFKKGKELEDLIINSHFVIIPSECFENLTMAGVEALSMSKPIIVSNLGGLMELVDNENNGFLFEAGSIESLKKAIQKSANLPDEEYYKLSKNAFNFALKNFNPDNFYNRLIIIYRTLLNYG